MLSETIERDKFRSMKKPQKKTTSEQEKMYTAREIAETMGEPLTKVRRWLRFNLFPNQELREDSISRYWVVPASDLDAFQKPQIGRPVKKKAKMKKTS